MKTLKKIVVAIFASLAFFALLGVIWVDAKLGTKFVPPELDTATE